jgi:DDE family transposase
LLDDLKRLVEPATLGDPVRPLLWVSKSLDKLASALNAMGHSICPNSVRKLLAEIGFSRQVNRKAIEGASHPDRNAQFEYIAAEVLAAQAAGQPVISVDAKYARTGIMHGLESGARPEPRHHRFSGMNASAGVPRASFFFR